MHEIMIENAFLKIKILDYEKAYLTKKNIQNLTPEIRIRMRRAVSARLKKEIKILSFKHQQITKKVYEDSSTDVSWI